MASHGNRNTKLTHKALEVSQPSSLRSLTDEDAREIIENMTGFFRLLLKWDRGPGRVAGVGDTRESSKGEKHEK
jgi:hypothetical protein